MPAVHKAALRLEALTDLLLSCQALILATRKSNDFKIESSEDRLFGVDLFGALLSDLGLELSVGARKLRLRSHQKKARACALLYSFGSIYGSQA